MKIVGIYFKSRSKIKNKECNALRNGRRGRCSDNNFRENWIEMDQTSDGISSYPNLHEGYYWSPSGHNLHKGL